MPQAKQSDTTIRVIPSSLPAEAAVLGSMILDPRCIGDVIRRLDAKSFYHPEHRAIFEAIVSLWEKRETGVDGFLVRDELDRRKQLNEIGGWEYLQKVMETVPSSANVEYYATIIEEKALARGLIAALTDSLADAWDSRDIHETIDVAEQRVFSISERRATQDAAPMKSLVIEAFDAIEKRDGSRVTGLATGFYELDDLTCGLQKGEMIIIAGRPSMGKTAWSLNVAEHLALIGKVPVAIFSLEMGRQQLAERFLCSYSGVDSQLVRKGMLGQGDYQKLIEAVGCLSDAPLFIDDSSSMTPMELRAKARRLVSKEHVQCIIIDYLQLMTVGGKVESRQQEITTISRNLKSLARELSIPVVVLSQLNRAPEGRENHRPRMSDLRESGSIEQDADVVMLLHREDYYHKGDPGYVNDNIAEVILCKQRNGPTGTIRLTFRDKCTRFENLARVDGEPF